jgi:hypothetical protein
MTYDGVEYRIWFDGAHHGGTDDLLCCPRRIRAESQEFVDAMPSRREPMQYRSADAFAADESAILACLQQKDCSRGELKATTGLSECAFRISMVRPQRSRQIRATSWNHYTLGS